ncbi:MAG: glycosyltransferase [Planctomycetales bacterium]|nr:glycosyltransferase [Planctomycetales bacterium]
MTGNNPPLVSVVMPSYNHELYIAQAIESVQEQTVRDWELIIIDDASRDQSRQVIERYAANDKRIRTIFHDTNQGIARTFNDGLDAAKGRYIALFASDDLWIPLKLQKQLPILEKNDNLIVWSEGLVVDSEGNPTGELFTENYGGKGREKSGDLFAQLLESSFICGQSCLFKRDNIRNIRFDPALKYFNDYKFQIDLASRYSYYFIPEPLIKYRRHGNNTTSRDSENWWKDTVLLRQTLIRDYGSKMSPAVKGKLLYSIAKNFSLLKDQSRARAYAQKAFLAYPFRLRYAKALLTGEIL